TNNDDGWRTATDLSAKGVAVTAVIDTRSGSALAEIPGAQIIMGARVMNTSGRRGLTSVTLTDHQTIPVECLAVSGGWNPNVHLTCHQRGYPVWRDDIAAFVPGADLPPGMSVAGAANGNLTMASALVEGLRTANKLVEDLGFAPVTLTAPKAEDEPHDSAAFWHV
ncbi:sarcosine oxidase subunit alpha, partial [Escherichia coli]|nr:sarcosine oxidase subunit alpha [Escherichia coli]